MIRVRRSLFALLLMAAAHGAAASDTPEKGYEGFHRAVLASFDPRGWFSHLTAELQAKYDKDTQASLAFVNKIQFMKDEMPRAYRVTGKAPGPGGKGVRLGLAGEGKDFFGKPAALTGSADLVSEAGKWKLASLTWAKRTAP